MPQKAEPNSSTAKLRLRTACCAKRGWRSRRSRVRRGQWMDGKFVERDNQGAHQAELQRALQGLTDDLTVAEFLRPAFRRSPNTPCCAVPSSGRPKVTTPPIRSGPAPWSFVTNGWSADIIRKAGSSAATARSLNSSRQSVGTARLRSASVRRFRPSRNINGGVLVRGENGDAHCADAVILTVPLPLLDRIGLPAAERERAAAAAQIGFGNVIKTLAPV